MNFLDREDIEYIVAYRKKDKAKALLGWWDQRCDSFEEAKEFIAEKCPEDEYINVMYAMVPVDSETGEVLDE